MGVNISISVCWSINHKQDEENKGEEEQGINHSVFCN